MALPYINVEKIKEDLICTMKNIIMVQVTFFKAIPEKF